MSKGSPSTGANRQAEMKLTEADGQVKEADKLASKTLLRWKPDWEGAGMLYDKAATNYKNAKAYEKAKETFKKASNAQYEMDLVYSAAKHMESAALMAKELKQNDEGAVLYEKASRLYRENGSGFNAAENLSKAAKLLENTNLEKSMDYLKQACEVYEVEDKQHYSGDTFKIAISLFLKNQKYADCVELMKNQARVFQKLNSTHDLHKCYLSMIIIHLYCDDAVAASNLYNQFNEETSTFIGSGEGLTAGEILDAYEGGNPEALQKAVNKQLLTFLDNQVCKIARNMRISDSLVPENTMGTVTPAPQNKNTSPLFSSSSTSSRKASAPPVEEEDDENLL